MKLLHHLHAYSTGLTLVPARLACRQLLLSGPLVNSGYQLGETVVGWRIAKMSPGCVTPKEEDSSQKVKGSNHCARKEFFSLEISIVDHSNPLALEV